MAIYTFSKLHPSHISITVVYFTICSSNITSKNAMKTKQAVSTHGLTIASCKYRIVRNFRGTKFLRIGCWQRFREKVFVVRRLQSHTHTGCLLTTPTSHESAAMAKELSVEAMVRGYHIYEDIWDATAGEEQPCQSPILKPSSTSHDSLT